VQVFSCAEEILVMLESFIDSNVLMAFLFFVEKEKKKKGVMVGVGGRITRGSRRRAQVCP
jgi:hypothetical protein